ncbi:Asparagine-linked glycosylation protein 6 [Saitozyma sp. JCM 24511]|nr:Asparagine-linked glycosylation protein 6 [Saitozyma sp. JCM 24511]
MPPASAGSSLPASLGRIASQPLALVRALLFERRYFFHLVGLLVLGELVLGLLIIAKIPYTKIDWTAYMEQVDMFLDGEDDYSEIQGETGPLVYPALHLYIYTALHQLLPSDSRERPAQFVFLGLYIFNLLSISAIYYLAGRPRERTPPLSAEDTTTKVSPDGPLSPASPPTSSSFYASSSSHIPQALLIPLTLSKREHSIYLLRLFNDPFAMALLYLAVLAFMLGGSRGWRIGCVVFSLALGVKMNILLFLPGLICLLFQYRGLVGTLEGVLTIVAVQVLLPSPFFLSFEDPYLTRAYFASAFDFSRQFFYKWTVNWRFLSERFFLSQTLSTSLVATHLGLLVLFGLFKWSPVPGGTVAVLKRGLRPSSWSRPAAQIDNLPAYHIPLVLFTSNLIGMMCARSLHYQFHSWYFLQIPLLLYMGGAGGSLIIGIAVWCAIEYGWMTYPASPTSSGVLLASHLIMIAGLFAQSRTPNATQHVRSPKTAHRVDESSRQDE